MRRCKHPGTNDLGRGLRRRGESSDAQADWNFASSQVAQGRRSGGRVADAAPPGQDNGARSVDWVHFPPYCLKHEALRSSRRPQSTRQEGGVSCVADEHPEIIWTCASGLQPVGWAACEASVDNRIWHMGLGPMAYGLWAYWRIEPIGLLAYAY